MVTVPVDYAFNVLVGSSLALASRASFTATAVWRSPALWSLVVFEALVFVPGGMLLAWEFPHWSVMYLIDPTKLPVPVWALALAYPLLAGASFVGVRKLLMGGRATAGVGVAAFAALATALLVWAGAEQLTLVGTYEAFHALPRPALKSIRDTPLIYLAAGVMAFVGAGWIATLWRLHAVDRATRRHAEAQSNKRAPAPGGKGKRKT